MDTCICGHPIWPNLGHVLEVCFGREAFLVTDGLEITERICKNTSLQTLCFLVLCQVLYLYNTYMDRYLAAHNSSGTKINLITEPFLLLFDNGK